MSRFFGLPIALPVALSTDSAVTCWRGTTAEIWEPRVFTFLCSSIGCSLGGRP